MEKDKYIIEFTWGENIVHESMEIERQKNNKKTKI